MHLVCLSPPICIFFFLATDAEKLTAERYGVCNLNRAVKCEPGNHDTFFKMISGLVTEQNKTKNTHTHNASKKLLHSYIDGV